MEFLLPLITFGGAYLATTTHDEPPPPTPHEGFVSPSTDVSPPRVLRETIDPFMGSPGDQTNALQPIGAGSTNLPMSAYKGPQPYRPWTKSINGHPHFVPDRSLGKATNRRGDDFYDQSVLSAHYRGMGVDPLAMRKQTQTPLFAPTVDRHLYGLPAQTGELESRMRHYTLSTHDNAAKPMEVTQQSKHFQDHIGDLWTHGRGLRSEDYSIRQQSERENKYHTPAFVPHADAANLDTAPSHQRKRKREDTLRDDRMGIAQGIGGVRVDPSQLPLKRQPELLDQSYSGLENYSITVFGAQPNEGPMYPEIHRPDIAEGRYGYMATNPLGRVVNAEEPDNWNNRSDSLAREDQTLFGNVSDILYSAFLGPLTHLHKDSRKHPENARVVGNMSHGQTIGARLTVDSAPSQAGLTMKELNMFHNDGYIDQLPSAQAYWIPATHDVLPRNEPGDNAHTFGQAGYSVNQTAVHAQPRLSERMDGALMDGPRGGMSLSHTGTNVNDRRRGDVEKRDYQTPMGSATGFHRADNRQFGQSTRGLERDPRQPRSAFDLQESIASMRNNNPMMISANRQQNALQQGFR